MTLCLPFAHSIDGHPLRIDELKGTKPTEKIDFSNKGLGVASAIIIASCIKDNESLKELKCAPTCQMPICQPPMNTFPLGSHQAREE